MITKTGSSILYKLASFDDELKKYPVKDKEDPPYPYEDNLDRIVGLLSNPRREHIGKIQYGLVDAALAKSMRDEQFKDVASPEEIAQAKKYDGRPGKLYFSDGTLRHTGDRHVAAIANGQTIVTPDVIHRLLKNIAVNANKGTLKHDVVYVPHPKDNDQDQHLMAWVPKDGMRAGDYLDFASIAAQKDGSFNTISARPLTFGQITNKLKSNPHEPKSGIPVHRHLDYDIDD